MYAVCENIYYANQVVCFPLPSISGTGAVRRSVMNIKQFLESLIWWLVYEAGKPLSANAAKHCLGWARPSSAHNAAEDGGGIFPWTASPGSPTFLTLPFLPWGTDLPCLQPSWDLWAVQSSLASLLNPTPTDGLPVLLGEEHLTLVLWSLSPP